jgi:cation diffusion facilitator family transporter
MENRYESSKKAGVMGILGNIFLLIIKGAIGLFSHSQAMIADAANSLGDIFSSAMTSIGSKIASAPQDDDHNFGHGKAEYIFSLLISISMVAVAFKLLYDSVTNLIMGSMFDFSWMLVLVCIITIVTKFCLFLYTRRLYKISNSLLLKANMKDHRNDCIITTFTLISVLLSLCNIYWFDSVVGIGISVWICITGVKIFLESYNVLMDKAIDEKTKEEIFIIVNKYKEIKGTKHFTSTPVGYQYLISISIDLDGNMSTFESHEIADNLEKELNKLPAIYLSIIHVNPV